MEIAIGVFIGIVITLVVGKRSRYVRKSSSSTGAEAERKQLQQADEELITVVLPMIKHDN